MIIIGLTGAIGHGKTSFADAIVAAHPHARHFETSDIIMRVANAWQATLETPLDPHDVNQVSTWLEKLPLVVTNTLGSVCDYQQLAITVDAYERRDNEYEKLILHLENLRRDFTKAHTQITSTNKTFYRPILQWLGGYLVMRVSPTIWFDQLITEAKQTESEGVEICVIGGLRYPADAVVVTHAGGIVIEIIRPDHIQSDALDPTERERALIEPDAIVYNISSLDVLADIARQIVGDISVNNLQSRYPSGY